MLLTLLLIWFVSRAVVGPLRSSPRRAGDVAEPAARARRVAAHRRRRRHVRSPPIEVQSEDEIGELAQAFNDVEAVTLQVAQEQSLLLRKGMGDLFVNLARRNQSLLQRQLELLDDLERNEHDPAALDALFKLDHMATRMRRNAESLLVLSGAEQPRQWQQPIALIDVVRAAAAEIADFPRVELVGIDDDLARVRTCRLRRRPPPRRAARERDVVLAPRHRGRRVGRGHRDRLRPRDLRPGHRHAARPHRRGQHLLAKPPVVGLALSRALGLHVVGSLAARHGISVELRPGAPIGLVALVPSADRDPRAATRRARRPTPRRCPTPHSRARRPADPLGARRMASRPPDEPPVEEWRARVWPTPRRADVPA